MGTKTRSVAPLLSYSLFAVLCFSLIPVIATADEQLPEGCINPQGVLVAFNTHRLTVEQKRLKRERKISGPNAKARLAAMAELISDEGIEVDSSLNLGPTIAKADSPGAEISEMEEALEDLPSVNAVAPDCEVSLNRNPNDQYYVSSSVGQWALNGTYGIDAPAAWDTTTGSNTVVVGVVDTGVTYDHPDLAANMWHNPDSTSPDVYGHDFVNNDSDPRDDQSPIYHGTHVAGTIGAVGNNGVGIAGVNWNVKIMALKVLGANGSGSWSGILAAITWAVAQKTSGVPIRVLNMSLGGGGLSQAFAGPITAAENAGIMIIAAAGNSGSNNDVSPSYPASFTNNNVISVAATDVNGAMASFSNYGVSSVDIAAPGVNILSTSASGYQQLSGTSMATPHVAGLAALLLSVSPSLTVTQFRSALFDSGTALSSLSGRIATGKLINAPRALAAARTSGYIVRGRVTLNGAAQAATITGGGVLGNTSADSQGYYQYTGLASGAAYTVTPSATCMTFSPASATGTISTDVIADFAATRRQFTLTGSVVDADDAPLSGVDVTVTTSSVQHVTSSSGSFSVSIPCQSAYTLSVSGGSYVFAPVSGTMSAAASVQLKAYRTGSYSITGRTLASDSTALSGVTVTATNSRGVQIAQVQSDSGGNYTISPVYNPETYTLASTKTGFTFSTRTVAVTGNATQNLTANAAVFTIRGYTLYQGNPIAGVAVSAGSLGSAVSDSSGRFQINSVPYHSNYTLTPSKASYTFNPTSISGTLGDDLIVYFYGNIPTYTISGRVVDGSGNPLAGVVVNGGSSLRSVQTGSSGVYTFSNLNWAESYSVSFTKSGYTLSPSSISGTISGNVARNITATLNRYNLTGIVRAHGQPLAGVLVNAGALGQQTTGSDGAYSFNSVAGLTPYSIRVSKTGYAFSPSVVSGAASIDTAETFTGTATSVTISGTVTLGGQPLAGVLIDGGRRGKRVSDSSGQYSFTVAPNSAYTLTPLRNGHTFDQSSVSGTAATSATVNFAATVLGYAVRGRATAGGQAVVGATIDGGSLGSTTTDSSGNYSFANVPYGTRYTITISKNGYSFGRPRASGGVIGNTSANFLGTALKYSISGRVLRPNSTGLSGVRISCGRLSATVSNRSGGFTLRNATYDLTCNLSGTRSGYTITPQTITVTGNLASQNLESNR